MPPNTENEHKCSMQLPVCGSRGSVVHRHLFKCIKAHLRVTAFSDVLHGLGLASYCSAIKLHLCPAALLHKRQSPLQTEVKQINLLPTSGAPCSKSWAGKQSRMNRVGQKVFPASSAHLEKEDAASSAQSQCHAGVALGVSEMTPYPLTAVKLG